MIPRLSLLALKIRSALRTACPGWLAFDPVSGVLSGTPGAACLGNNRVRFAVSDGSHTVSGILDIEVRAVSAADVEASTGVSTNTDADSSSGGGSFGLAVPLLPLLARWLGRPRKTRPARVLRRSRPV